MLSYSNAAVIRNLRLSRHSRTWFHDMQILCSFHVSAGGTFSRQLTCFCNLFGIYDLGLETFRCFSTATICLYAFVLVLIEHRTLKTRLISSEGGQSRYLSRAVHFQIQPLKAAEAPPMQESCPSLRPKNIFAN